MISLIVVFINAFALNITAKDQSDGPSSSASKRRLFVEPDNQPSADYVDINLTYEALERLSLNLEKQIMNIDTERSIEFEKRSASKPRSNSSSSKLPGSLIGSSLSVSHVRKLTYSNESLDKLSPFTNQIRRVKSDNALRRGPGRPRKSRCATTEGSKMNKGLPNILALQNVPTQCKHSKPKETSQNLNDLNKIPKKRGRPRKNIPTFIEKTDKIEQMQKNNKFACDNFGELNQSIPDNLNQPLKDESSIRENKGSIENITIENNQIEIEEEVLDESTTENEKVIEKNILVESVEKLRTQQENSNDSFVSAQEEFGSPFEPSDLANAMEDTLVEQLHVKAATEEESLKSEGAGKEPEEEPQTCDSAVDRDKDISAEKCEEETSVGQCIETVGDNMDQKIETVPVDGDLLKANTESISIDYAVDNLMESSAQDDANTNETRNSFKPKEGTSIVDANNLKEDEINIPKSEEVDNNLADDVKENCVNETVKDIETPNVYEESKQDEINIANKEEVDNNMNDVKENCANEPVKDIETPNVRKESKESSSCVKSTKSPCPTGRKSRSSKRTLKSDVDALVSKEVQRRNSPRFTEKSPAAERESPAQLKGIRKTKLDKSSIDSHQMTTEKEAANSKADIEKAMKEECLTETQSQSSNLDGEVISTEDMQTPDKAPETEVPVAESLSRKQKSRGAKSKFKNHKPSPRQQKSVLVKSNKSDLPKSNKNAQLLNDPSTSKDQINSTTDNASPSTDKYTASIPINSENKQEDKLTCENDEISESIPNMKNSSNDNPDLLAVPIICKEPLIDIVTHPTDNSIIPSPTKSQTKNESMEMQLTQTNTEILKSDDIQDLPISSTETIDIKAGVEIGCEIALPTVTDPFNVNNVVLSKINDDKNEKLGQEISKIELPTRKNREIRGLLNDNNETYVEHLTTDFRSTRLRTQTQNKQQILFRKKNKMKNNEKTKKAPVRKRKSLSSKIKLNKYPAEPETVTETEREANKLPNTDNLFLEDTMNINNEMEKETATPIISSTKLRKCCVRIKRVKLPFYTQISGLIDCKTAKIEKTLDDALIEDIQEHNKTDPIVITELVKHSVDEKVEDKRVELVAQKIDIDVKEKSEEIQGSLDSQNKTEHIEEERQPHSDITSAVNLRQETEQNTQMCTSSSLTETTGVTKSVDNINGDIVDGSQSDG